jgi:hypothetical protein
MNLRLSEITDINEKSLLSIYFKFNANAIK